MSAEWRTAASLAMDRYASGDDSAFSELYDLLAPRLSSFLLRRMGDAAATEDLLQQTFLQMHCARRHFVRGADVTPWAFAIARRLHVDLVRKRKPESALDWADDEVPPALLAPGEQPDTIVAFDRLARRVEDQLAQVPERQRAAFELVYGDGLSPSQAAHVLGTSVVAVRLRLHRACEALRKALGNHVHEEL